MGSPLLQPREGCRTVMALSTVTTRQQQSQQTHRLLYATLLLLLMLLFPKLQSDFTLFALISKAENLMIQISEIGIQPLAGTQHYIQGGLVSWKTLFSLLILHVKDNTATEKQHKNYTKDS